MTQPGYGILITGEKGGGKTHLAISLCAFHLLDNPQHNHVVSNIRICKRGTGPIEEDVSEYPPNYHRVQTLAGMFAVVSEILKQDPDAKILFVLDEAALFLGYLDYVSGLMKSTVKLNTLTRKLRIASIFIAVRAELIGKKFRDTGGLIDVTFMKDKAEIRRHASDFLERGYDVRELALIDWPEYSIYKEVLIVTRVPILTTPPNECKPGELYFDTMSLATFDTGVHPVTRKAFEVRDLILVLSASDLPRSQTIDLFYRFMHEDPAPLVKAAQQALYGFPTRGMSPTGSDIPAPSPNQEDAPGAGARESDSPRRHPFATDWKKAAVIKALKAHPNLTNAEIARLVSRPDDDVSPQYVGRVRRELQMEG